MGNCQAIDNATLIIQHPNGKMEKMYATITAAEVMKLNTGHYVALLLTTTVRHVATTKETNHGDVKANPQPVRVTRIKLLRHNESLTVGHIYRLVTTQEVMKGLMAKKNGKISNNIRQPKAYEQPAGKHEQSSVRSNQSRRTHHQIKRSEGDSRKTAVPVKSSAAVTKPRGWHPSLNSISEASN